MSSAHRDPRHGFADRVCGVAVGEACERVGQPGGWTKPIELAAFDERSDENPVVPAFV